ncbi:hypothetical protein Q7P37_008181 [Cladosporium fusiforme]
MSSSSNVGELKLESTDIKTAAGVELSSEQRTIVSSVLDLFAGRPSLAKLQLWKDDAVFSDPITIAQGRKQFEAQWYGLQSAFSEIERKSHTVTSSGNPISMDMSTFYKVKGIGKETTINSKINIFVEDGKIQRVEDKWDGNLPDSSIANVRKNWTNAVNPVFWSNYAFGWCYTGVVLVSDTSVGRAFRHLNSVTVPKMVGVPKNAEEDAKRGN